MFELGKQLMDVGALVRSTTPPQSNHPPYIQIFKGDHAIYYYLYQSAKTIPTDPQAVFLINNWDLSLYQFPHFQNPTPLLLGNYGERIEDADGNTSFISAQAMADRATGIQRVGHLRMDVDRLGAIFAKGLGKDYTLPRLAGLSRQMSYFFKVYLNSLAEYRDRNIPQQLDFTFKRITNRPRQDLLFIYAGGDDLFVSGAWDQVVEFAFDVNQSFRAFTGNNPSITLSAGIALCGPKYPLYQSAGDAGSAEDRAKGNGRDSLDLFGQVFKWEEWLGGRAAKGSDIESLDKTVHQYLQDDSTIALFGIFPFVNALKDLLGNQYSKSFVRNLLMTAQLQERHLASCNQKDSERYRDIRYFLHLPKVAYTLSRLPNPVKSSAGFNDISTSLKSPYNAPYFRAIATWLDLLNRSTSSVKEPKINA